MQDPIDEALALVTDLHEEGRTGPVDHDEVQLTLFLVRELLEQAAAPVSPAA